MQEIAGLTLGAVLVRRVSRLDQPLLRAAILAQTADLVTFAFIFQNGGLGERNPISHLSWELPKRHLAAQRTSRCSW